MTDVAREKYVKLMGEIEHLEDFFAILCELFFLFQELGGIENDAQEGIIEMHMARNLYILDDCKSFE